MPLELRLRPRHALWAVIGAVHLLLGWQGLRLATVEAPDGQRMTVRLVAAPVPLLASAPRAPEAPLPRAPRAGTTAPASPAAPPPLEQPAAAHEPADLATPGPAAPEAPGVPPAQPSLLGTEATRLAVRQAARQPLLSERAASATQDPGRETAQARLGREIQQAGTTDCLKGEFAGGGMGLLSLPFWLVAEARGKCRR